MILWYNESNGRWVQLPDPAAAFQIAGQYDQIWCVVNSEYAVYNVQQNGSGTSMSANGTALQVGIGLTTCRGWSRLCVIPPEFGLQACPDISDLGCRLDVSSTMVNSQFTLMRDHCRSLMNSSIQPSRSTPIFIMDRRELSELSRWFRNARGTIAIAGAGLMQEIEGEILEALKNWWEPAMLTFHSAGWWRRHWERTGILDIECGRFHA